MLLGSNGLRSALESGDIVCTPPPATIEATHIDVHLGDAYWVANLSLDICRPGLDDPRALYRLRNAVQDEGVFLPPGTPVLAHTLEFIGSTVPFLQPIMHGRSSVARWGIEVHLAAGWGDPGYCSRWTLEVINHRAHSILLPRGIAIACVAFLQVAYNETCYTGHYNVPSEQWTPEVMLPKNLG
jgi:dCTP deaminase